MNDVEAPPTGVVTVPIEGTELDPVGVTIEDAMRLLRVGRKTIERLLDGNHLEAFTIGTSASSGGLRITMASIKALPARRPVDTTKRHPRRANN